MAISNKTKVGSVSDVVISFGGDTLKMSANTVTSV